jgi:hypothetical protein
MFKVGPGDGQGGRHHDISSLTSSRGAFGDEKGSVRHLDDRALVHWGRVLSGSLCLERVLTQSILCRCQPVALLQSNVPSGRCQLMKHISRGKVTQLTHVSYGPILHSNAAASNSMNISHQPMPTAVAQVAPSRGETSASYLSKNGIPAHLCSILDAQQTWRCSM